MPKFSQLFLLTLALNLTESALAVTLTVFDPCGDVDILAAEYVGEVGTSVGDNTIEQLTAARIPFVGTASGINQILRTPIGDDALEIISDTEMRAYGWCYAINDFEPSLTSDQVYIEHQTDRIEWFFGYAHYLEGEWITYCTPTHIDQPDYICSRVR